MARKPTVTVSVIGEADRLRQTFDEASRRADEFAGHMGQAGQRAGGGLTDGFSGAESGIMGKLGGLKTAGVAAVAAAAAAIGAALWSGIQDAFERQDVGALVAARLGQGELAAAWAGNLAGDIYADNFGESVADVGDALSSLLTETRNMPPIGEDALQGLTQDALTLAQVFGTDVQENVRAASALVRTGLAPDFQSAFDLIALGYQNGADRSGDFLDTLFEYSGMFAGLGLDAQDFINVLVQGLDAGAWNADKVADAVKEFSIRAIDGSELTAQAFRDLGLDAEDTAAAIAAGGPGAEAAFTGVMDAVRGIADPLEQNRIGVALFGTQWEDSMRAAVLAIDPTTGSIQGVTDATGQMADMLGSTASARVEAFQRTMKDKLVDWLGSSAIPAIEEFAANWDETWAAIDTWTSDLWTRWQLGWDIISQFFVDAWQDSGLAEAFYGTWQFIQDLFNTVTNVIMGTWRAFTGLLTGDWGRMWQGIKQVAEGIWTGLSGAWGRLWGFMKEVVGGALGAIWSAVTANFDMIVGFITGLPGRIAGAASGMWDGIKNAFRAALNWIIDKWNGLSFTLPSVSVFGQTIGGGTISTPDLPRFAQGGLANGWAVVGERGPELAHFSNPARIYSNSDSRAMVGSSPTVINFHGNVYGLADFELAVAEAVASGQRRGR